MSFYQCLGRQETYGDKSVGGIDGYIYKGFRFRDPTTPQTGMAQPIIISPTFADNSSEMISTTVEIIFKDFQGLIWKQKTGIPPDNHWTQRNVFGKTLDYPVDQWKWGVQCTPKENPQTSKNESTLISSSWKSLKDRGILS